MRQWEIDRWKIEQKLKIESLQQWVTDRYEEGQSSIEIAEFLHQQADAKMTTRSIQRIVQKGLFERGKLPRTQKEAFNLAIKKGRVQWKYKDVKIRRYQLNKQIRFEVLERDKFRCVLCGSTPRESILEVDHIVPICKGGDSSMDNLRVLCYECNQGKRLKEKEA